MKKPLSPLDNGTDDIFAVYSPNALYGAKELMITVVWALYHIYL